MDKSAPLNDPFEAFKRKKKTEAEQAQRPAAQEALTPREDGRPRGFNSHRYDFVGTEPKDAVPAPPPEAPPRPKGYKPTKIADGPLPVDETPPKPKGFKTHHLT